LPTSRCRWGPTSSPGQIVTVGADHGQSELARCIAESAYKRGAKFVDVQYFDPYVKRARIAYAADETLPFVPSWFSYRMLAIGEERAARISLAGPTTTGLLDDLDPDRAGRDQLPFVKEVLKVIGDRTTNWTVVPCPTEPWALPCLPRPGAGRGAREAVGAGRPRLPSRRARSGRRLERASGRALRRAVRLNDREFDALHFEGAVDRSDDRAAGDVHVPRRPGRDGGRIVHLANLPTEEVYATPDPQRADGHVPLDEAARPRRRHDHPRLEVRFEAAVRSRSTPSREQG
jgi:aminopeptidase